MSFLKLYAYEKSTSEGGLLWKAPQHSDNNNYLECFSRAFFIYILSHPVV